MPKQSIVPEVSQRAYNPIKPVLGQVVAIVTKMFLNLF
jgi:hypothetical protein